MADDVGALREDVGTLRGEVGTLQQDVGTLRGEVGTLREETNQRFEQVDQQFVDVRQEMRDQKDELRQEMHDQKDKLRQEMHDLRDYFDMITGRVQTRGGRKLEDVIAGALRVALERPDVDPQTIKLRQKMYDREGLVFRRNKKIELDILVNNGDFLVFEAKSSPKPDDVDFFADKVELLQLQNPDKNVHGLLISVSAEDDVREAYTERGIRLVP